MKKGKLKKELKKKKPKKTKNRGKGGEIERVAVLRTTTGQVTNKFDGRWERVTGSFES